MPSPEAGHLAEELRAFRVAAASRRSASLREQRRRAGWFGRLATEPEGVRRERIDAGGVPALLVRPPSGDVDRVIEYLHGGGYVVGDSSMTARLCGHLARSSSCAVVSVDYRRAPEHPHPAALQDARRALDWLHELVADPGRIALAGDSAGGGLAAATQLAVGDGLRVGALALWSPWVDLTCSGATYRTNAHRDLLVNRSQLLGRAASYLAGRDPNEPLVSPLRGDLGHLPPTYVQVGSEEVLLDDARQLVGAAMAVGAEISLDVVPHMQHLFHYAVGHVPEATEAVERLGRWLDEHLGPTDCTTTRVT